GRRVPWRAGRVVARRSSPDRASPSWADSNARSAASRAARALATASQPRRPNGRRDRDGLSSSGSLQVCCGHGRTARYFSHRQGCIMRLRLTRKLQRVGLMLIVALGIQLPAFAEGNSLASDEPARYLSELRKLYLTRTTVPRCSRTATRCCRATPCVPVIRSV